MARYRRRRNSRPRKHREWMPVHWKHTFDVRNWTWDDSQHFEHDVLPAGAAGDGINFPEHEGTLVRLRGELTFSWRFSFIDPDSYIHTLVGWTVVPQLASPDNRNPFNDIDTDYFAIHPVSCMVYSNAQTINAYEIDSKAKRRFDKGSQISCIAGFVYSGDPRQSGSSTNLSMYFSGRALIEY